MRDFKKLQIWDRSYKLCIDIYEITKHLPAEEKFGITSQIRRSAISVPSNIAEGSAKRSRKDFANFLTIALGSLFELETQLSLARDLDLISQDRYNPIQTELINIKAMLIAYIDRIYKSQV